MDANKDDHDKVEPTKQAKPLPKQARKILKETPRAFKGAGHHNRTFNKAKRNGQNYRATAEVQRLTEALRIVSRRIVIDAFHSFSLAIIDAHGILLASGRS